MQNEVKMYNTIDKDTITLSEAKKILEDLQGLFVICSKGFFDDSYRASSDLMITGWLGTPNSEKN